MMHQSVLVALIGLSCVLHPGGQGRTPAGKKYLEPKASVAYAKTELKSLQEYLRTGRAVRMVTKFFSPEIDTQSGLTDRMLEAHGETHWVSLTKDSKSSVLMRVMFGLVQPVACVGAISIC
jgi:hypothetical protein